MAKYKIGDRGPANGWIFNIENDIYYEVAPKTCKSLPWEGAKVYCANFKIKNNNQCFEDWYLPTKKEMRLVHLNIFQKKIGRFSDGYHWTSSEYKKCVDCERYEGNNKCEGDKCGCAWLQGFATDPGDGDDNGQADEYKYSEYPFRAVRSFKI